MEHQYDLLMRHALASELNIFGLHSSIDIDECIRTIERAARPDSDIDQQTNSDQKRRTVILATNIAESSVTGIEFRVCYCYSSI